MLELIHGQGVLPRIFSPGCVCPSRCTNVKRVNFIRVFRAFSGVLLVLLLGIGLNSPIAGAQDAEFVMGKNSLVNSGKDNGFSERNPVDKDDPHWGWEMGDFRVSGFTRVTEDNHGTPVLLKNVGDTVTLWFELGQDIDKQMAMRSCPVLKIQTVGIRSSG